MAVGACALSEFVSAGSLEVGRLAAGVQSCVTARGRCFPLALVRDGNLEVKVSRQVD